jgi:uncharacterized protein YjbI with pentapeptide repeats
MKGLDARYAPPNWWPWWCREVGVRLGADETKIRNTALELRRISPRTLARCLRPPFNWGRRADLRWANLAEANLSRADLRGADLHGADLRWANLTEANLARADLRWANLTRADLRGANLDGADLRWANLDGARWDKRTVWPDDFIPSEKP